MSVVQKVSDIARPIVEGLGIELIDAEYVKEGSKWILRLYIDKKGGVGLDDCEAVSRAVEPAIDAEDPIREPYVFEVSSPGLERPLKTDRDFDRYEGRNLFYRERSRRCKADNYLGINIGGYEEE